MFRDAIFISGELSESRAGFSPPKKENYHQGKLAEHIVGQELLGKQVAGRGKQCFWVREKTQSQAEVDFIIQHGEKVVPVEVKAGPAGRLRSLHQFMDSCPHRLAVRLYAGPLDVQQTTTLGGKGFTLINMPYFLAAKVPDYLQWVEGEWADS